MANQNAHLLLLVLSFLSIFITKSMAGAPSYNVQTLGARPDGVTDSTKYFLSAWASACNSAVPAVVYVPPGKFLVGVSHFEGPCNNNGVTIRILGTLIASTDYRSDTWLQFHRVDGLTILGGSIDGQGTGLWNCKSSGKSCPSGATSLSIGNSNNVAIVGLTSLNSQMFHIAINGCEKVKFQGVKVFAAGNSPNTDGIHIQKSTDVSVVNSVIATGDDCISMGPGTTNVWIEQVTCGPGHGISIGSLGWGMQEPGVQNVTVKSVTFKGTQNGFRIKTWARPSDGFVRDITFQDAIMVNVGNPIMIDQNYCPTHNNCPSQGSGVKISDVTFSNIPGISASEVALKFDCSKKAPCTGITLGDVKLTCNSEAAQAWCVNAAGTISGPVEPAGCSL